MEYNDCVSSGAGRIEKLGGQNVGGSGDMLPRENFENSQFLECYFLHLQEPFKTFIRSKQYYTYVVDTVYRNLLPTNIFYKINKNFYFANINNRPPATCFSTKISKTVLAKSGGGMAAPPLPAPLRVSRGTLPVDHGTSSHTFDQHMVKLPRHSSHRWLLWERTCLD